MNPEKTSTTRLALEKVQLFVTSVTLVGMIAYVGKQLAVSEQQSRLLEGISTDITVIKERNADANAQIKVLSERVSQVERRLERMEQARP
jgi:hypothetical protein